MNPQDYVVPDAEYVRRVREASGAPPVAGMAPYPLYGIPGLGEDVPTPFYRQPAFCYIVGGIAGVGAGYLFWGWFLPRWRKFAASGGKP